MDIEQIDSAERGVGAESEVSPGALSWVGDVSPREPGASCSSFCRLKASACLLGGPRLRLGL